MLRYIMLIFDVSTLTSALSVPCVSWAMTQPTLQPGTRYLLERALQVSTGTSPAIDETEWNTCPLYTWYNSE